jgi:hypothetical protein
MGISINLEGGLYAHLSLERDWRCEHELQCVIWFADLDVKLEVTGGQRKDT